MLAKAAARYMLFACCTQGKPYAQAECAKQLRALPDMGTVPAADIKCVGLTRGWARQAREGFGARL